MSFFEELLVNNSKEDDAEDSFRTASITTGIVKENWDEKYPGMVRVELMLGEDGQKTTEWVRVAMPYAGKEFGEYFLPEVDTEVVIAFNMGDINCPIIIGSLWNNKDTIPKQTVNKENSVKRIKTKGGHEIVFEDKKGEESIRIHTPGKLMISLEDEKELLSISDSSQENKITIDGKSGTITIKGKNKIVLNVGNEDMLILDGKSKSVEINATKISIEGKNQIDLKGNSAKFEGNMMEIKAKANMKVESSGIMAVKGAMVKIN